MSITAEPVASPRRRNRRPEFTKRDGAAIAWLGEQYGARLDVLSALLGRLGETGVPLSRWAVRDQVERWERQRLVTTERALGDTWVTPTRYGLDRAGLDSRLSPWKVPVTRVRHTHAVNVLRLYYEGRRDAAAAPWVSERMTYLERGREYTWHVPDAVVKDPRAINETGPPRFFAIEVELEHKGRRRYETEVFGKLRFGIGAVWYFVPDDREPERPGEDRPELGPFGRRLQADIEAVRARQGFTLPVVINLLPEVAGVSYMTKR